MKMSMFPKVGKKILSSRVPISYCRLQYIHAKTRPSDRKSDEARCHRHRKQLSSLHKGWEAVIGLEIHAQIASKSKLFSGSGTEFAAPVNSQVSLFDAALPGTLPVLNRQSVEAGVITGLALGCHVNKISRFDRKHYFYADLPQGYQITQQRQPIAAKGSVSFLVSDRRVGKEPYEKTARITQIQLEQDSGKSLHDSEAAYSLIDLNRAGVGLMEIVTEPDFYSGEEAAAFVKEMHLILTTLGTCDGKMAEGSLRVDANVSVNRPGEPLGIRSEVKNIGSIRFVAKAVEFEIKRHIKILESGGEVINETRSYDFETGKTVAMRDKERLQDYRFMPEPNLPPLRLYTNADIPKHIPHDQIVNLDNLKEKIPELPHEVRTRLQKRYGLTPLQSIFVVNTEGMLDYLQTAAALFSGQTRDLITVLQNDVMEQLNTKDMTISNCPLKPEILAEILKLRSDGIISKLAAKMVVAEIMSNPRSPMEVITEKNLKLLTDRNQIEHLVNEALAANQDKVNAYKKGKRKALPAVMRVVHEYLGGRADPVVINETIMKQLSS